MVTGLVESAIAVGTALEADTLGARFLLGLDAGAHAPDGRHAGLEAVVLESQAVGNRLGERVLAYICSIWGRQAATLDVS